MVALQRGQRAGLRPDRSGAGRSVERAQGSREGSHRSRGESGAGECDRGVEKREAARGAGSFCEARERAVMKIIRYQSATGETGYAQQLADGTATKLRGEIFTGFTATDEPADVAKLLAPLEPRALLCIGLNY